MIIIKKNLNFRINLIFYFIIYLLLFFMHSIIIIKKKYFAYLVKIYEVIIIKVYQ